MKFAPFLITFTGLLIWADLTRNWEPAKMDDADLGAVANVDITLSSEDKPENVDSVERLEFFFYFPNS